MKVDRIQGSQDHITEEAVRLSAAKRLPSGSVLFVTRSGILAHTFPVAVTTVDVTVNQDLKAVTPHPGFSPDYVAWAARALGGEILRRCSKDGTTVASIDTEQLMRVELPIAPLPEQHRIVEAVESYFTRLSTAVDTLERTQRNVERYRASVLKAVVEGRLVRKEAELARAEGRDYEPASALLARIRDERRGRWQEAGGRIRYQAAVHRDTPSLPPLAEGWCWTTIGAVCECLDRARVPVSKKEREKRRGTVPYYGANGQVGWIDEPLFNERLVLVVEDETFIGRTKPFSYLISGPSWVNNHAHVLRATGAVYPEYLNYSLAYYPFTRLTTGTTGRRKLTQEVMLSAPYPLPPLAEQERIVALAEHQLSIIAQASRSARDNITRCKSLRQSILKWAFEGKLADQDPSDEPASVLLERIRSETLAGRSSEGNTEDVRLRRGSRRKFARAERKS